MDIVDAIVPVACGLQALDVFMAGDDVTHKKPDPSIYVQAANQLHLKPTECLVIEDSMIGLQVCIACRTYG